MVSEPSLRLRLGIFLTTVNALKGYQNFPHFLQTHITFIRYITVILNSIQVYWDALNYYHLNCVIGYSMSNVTLDFYYPEDRNIRSQNTVGGSSPTLLSQHHNDG